MRLVVAPDKYAGTLSAPAAAQAIASGWRRVRPEDVVDEVPLADGGPGFLDVLRSALGGRSVPVTVEGPLGAPAQAHLLVVDASGQRSGRTVYVEAAQACGLDLVGEPSPDTAMSAGTAGVGELLRSALTEGPARVVVGVGGTASTDGGRACLARLGGAGAWPTDVGLAVATDVGAPLLGPRGAAAVYGPQKGAGQAQVRLLEQRLVEWAEATGGPSAYPGAGAGGGLGYGLILLGAQVVPGLQTVLDAVRLEDLVRGADLVLTGEGRVDGTSLTGKVVGGVARLSRAHDVRCVVLAGDRSADVDAGALDRAGVRAVHTLVGRFGAAAAMTQPAECLADLAAGLAAQA